uniref:C2H2-type domain-containing protein n=1 Tax=Clytia hemisphaerica TaxID=252671 RepID=A0A7M5VG98_9CNID
MEGFACDNCNFESQTLKLLLRHIYCSHSQSLNFRTKCTLCELYFTKHNSLYKHTLRHHRELFNAGICADADQNLQENERYVEQENHEDDFINQDYHDDHNDDSEKDDDSSLNETLSSTELSDHEDTENSGFSDDSSDEASDFDEDDMDIPPENIHEEEDQDDPDLKEACCSFILKVKDKHNLSQVSLESIMESTKYLSTISNHLLKEKIKGVLERHNFPHIQETENVFDENPGLFEGLETLPLQNRYIAEHYDLLSFKEIFLGNKMKYKKKGSKQVIAEDQDTFIYIPIIESLHQLLKDSMMRKELLREPQASAKDVLFDFQDGELFQNDKYFQDHKDAIALIIFHDEIEVCNPLGSKAGKHKLDLYYYRGGGAYEVLNYRHPGHFFENHRYPVQIFRKYRSR